MRHITLWATTGFLLLQFGWISVIAPFAAMDEFDHAYRASSVANGHIKARRDVAPPDFARGDLIPVRADIVTAANPACSKLDYTRPYDCRPWKELSGDEVFVGSSAARYNPAYYAVVGLASKPFHGNAALYVMRIVSALICSALFALSIGLTASWARTKWPLIAIVLAALPTTVYSTSVAAPNGIQLMAGLAVWSALLCRFYSRRSSPLTYLVIAACAVILVNTHTLGTIWLACIATAAAMLVGLRSFVAHVRPDNPMEWTIIACAAPGLLFAPLWVLLARTNDPSGPIVLEHSAWPLLPREMLLWPLQAIAAFPFRDEPAPPFVYAVGLIVLVAYAALAMRVGREGKLARSILFTVVVSYVVPVVLTAATFSRLGLNWQGRYGMPFTAGLLLLFGLTLERATVPLPRRIMVVALLGWAVMEIVSQSSVLHRQADDPVLEHTGWWAPPTTLIVALGVGAFCAWYRSLTIGDVQPEGFARIDSLGQSTNPTAGYRERVP